LLNLSGAVYIALTTVYLSGTDSTAKVSNIRISKDKIRVENHLLPFFEESELCLLLAL